MKNVVVIKSDYEVKTVEDHEQFIYENQNFEEPLYVSGQFDPRKPRLKVNRLPIESVTVITKDRFGSKVMSKQNYVVDQPIKEYCENVYGGKIRNLEADVAVLTSSRSLMSSRIEELSEENKQLRSVLLNEKVEHQHTEEDFSELKKSIRTLPLLKLVIFLWKFRMAKQIGENN
jgi:hypothetical protein